MYVSLLLGSEAEDDRPYLAWAQFYPLADRRENKTCDT